METRKQRQEREAREKILSDISDNIKRKFKIPYILRKVKMVDNTGNLSQDFEIKEKRIEKWEIPVFKKKVYSTDIPEKKIENPIDISHLSGRHKLNNYIPVADGNKIPLADRSRFIDGSKKGTKSYSDEQFDQMYKIDNNYIDRNLKRLIKKGKVLTKEERLSKERIKNEIQLTRNIKLRKPSTYNPNNDLSYRTFNTISYNKGLLTIK